MLGSVLLFAFLVSQSPFDAGLDAYRRRDFARAVTLLAPAVEQGPSDPKYQEAVAALGLSYHLLGDSAKAVPLLEKSSGWAPQNVELAYALGISCLAQHRADAARSAFARMFRLPPKSPHARLITARFMVRERLEEEAAREIAPLAASDPALPGVHFLLGELAIFRADMDAAIRELELETAVNPTFAMAYYRLGDAFTRKEMWAEAVPALQKAIWLNPDFSSPYILLGKTYFRLGHAEFAEGMLRRALALDPNNAGAHYLLGTVLRAAGRDTEARKEFEAMRQLKTEPER